MCDTEKPATDKVFVRDSSRNLGIGYECLDCHHKRRKGRDRTKELWANLTPRQRKLRSAAMLRYVRTARGRASNIRHRYNGIDACDISQNEMHEILSRPCIYCGTTSKPRGLDRIDNSKPHVHGNVNPACRNCNSKRGNRLTVEQMIERMKAKSAPNEHHRTSP